MYRIVYTIENALKNLIRMKDLLVTLLMILFIGCCSFTSLFLLHIFQAWKNELVRSDNFIAFVPTSIFSFFILILCFTLFLFLVLYTKNVFRSYFFIQKNEILTMSFLGNSFHLISLEYAIQPVCCLLFILPLASFIGQKIVDQFVVDFLSSLNLTSVKEPSLLFILAIIFLCCLLVFYSVYRFIKSLVKI